MSSTRSGNPSSSPQPFEHAGPGSKSQQHTDITGISSAGSNESQDNSLRAVAVELAQDLSMEPLCAHPVKDTQAQIRTVASQIDGVHTQIGQIKDQVPSIHQQTAAIIESAQALEQMYKQIDELAVLVERVAAAAYEANGKVEEAERDLSSTPLQPLQAMLESLKMTAAQ
ncbi:hypothetical protein B0O80DRAFT_498165 [Mortierella sp. GBAus27b]|nr:hypothetical protein B0O80DRAFT_498165 [Mortierella sp. GBAus27b]